ncbi:MAG TPA: hypothetical protein P5525_22550, partial [Candidatus Paceibacterota bacterium]|nr:hypothetical protein [Candidatus Paceibacterota bacterium]
MPVKFCSGPSAPPFQGWRRCLDFRLALAVLLLDLSPIAARGQTFGLFDANATWRNLVFDAALTDRVGERSDPRVLAVTPAPESALTQLTQVTVTFS